MGCWGWRDRQAVCRSGSGIPFPNYEERPAGRDGFANAGNVCDFGTGRLEVIFPGIGLGLRIKLNKFSNTNTCLDYGVGAKGSRGFFGNLGEVF
jgi:hypothetical protein